MIKYLFKPSYNYIDLIVIAIITSTYSVVSWWVLIVLFVFGVALSSTEWKWWNVVDISTDNKKGSAD